MLNRQVLKKSVIQLYVYIAGAQFQWYENVYILNDFGFNAMVQMVPQYHKHIKHGV